MVILDNVRNVEEKKLRFADFLNFLEFFQKKSKNITKKMNFFKNFVLILFWITHKN